jgi:hypothetical protein
MTGGEQLSTQGEGIALLRCVGALRVSPYRQKTVCKWREKRW